MTATKSAPSFLALLAVARDLGVTLVDRDDYEADAPYGVVFNANGLHSMVSALEFEDRPWPEKCPMVKGTRADARRDMLERLKMGVRPCDRTDCDVCLEETPLTETSDVG